jgi:uncharacterized membrane protein YesL
MAKRVRSHIVETALFSLMAIFAIPAIYVFLQIVKFGISYENASILALIIIVMTIFLQTVLMVRIYQQYE